MIPPRIKLEPEPIQNFIDDSELWEDDEYDEDEDLRRCLSKRRYQKLKNYRTMNFFLLENKLILWIYLYFLLWNVYVRDQFSSLRSAFFCS